MSLKGDYMEKQDMKLHELSIGEIAMKAVYPKEWVIDPPYLRYLDDKIAFRIIQIRMENLAKISKHEAEIKEIEADMYRDISKAFG